MNKFYITAIIVSFLAVALSLFYYYGILGAGKRNVCTQVWLTEADSGFWHIQKEKTCRMGENKLQTGYHQIDEKWFYVNASQFWIDCGFFKRCDQERVEHYLLSEDLAGFHVFNTNYAKDSQKVFYQKNSIDGALADSFRLVDDDFAVYSLDAARVYYLGEVLPQAEPQAFRVLGRRGGDVFYATDGQRVYLDGRLIQGAQMPGFRLFDGNELPDGIGLFWAHDAHYLYHYDKQLPHRLDMAGFKHIAARLFTDGQQVFELGVVDYMTMRPDIVLPVRSVSPFVVVDDKQQVFVNEYDGLKLYAEVDGASLKVVEPVCPSQHVYPHLKLNCANELKQSSNRVYFEDKGAIYFARFSESGDITRLLSNFVRVMDKVADEPVYILRVQDQDMQVVLHNDTLCTNHLWDRSLDDFVCTKVQGELIGDLDSRTFLADEDGFILFNESSEQDPTQLRRTNQKDKFGPLRLSALQLPSTSCVLENDVNFYIFSQSKKDGTDFLVNKKTLAVTEMESGEAVSPEQAASLLKGLGLQ